MIARHYYETDGACYAASPFGCKVLSDEFHEGCSTYECPFYKPMDCKDWIRKDCRHLVYLCEPEEVEYVSKDKLKRKGRKV